MKNRLIIIALGLSRPGTMGGNSKITIEMARCLPSAPLYYAANVL